MEICDCEKKVGCAIVHVSIVIVKVVFIVKREIICHKVNLISSFMVYSQNST